MAGLKFNTTTSTISTDSGDITLNAVAVTDIARKSQENLFTVPQFISLNTPQLWLNVANAPADERLWYLGANTEGLILGTSNDAGTTLDYGISITRVSGSPTVRTMQLKTRDLVALNAASITLTATNTTVNGVLTNTGGIQNASSTLVLVGVGATSVQGHVFTGSGLTLTHTSLPSLTLNESGGSPNNKNWLIAVAAEALHFYVGNDAQSVFTDFFTVQRTGTTVDSITLTATSIIINGDSAATIESGTFTGTLSGMVGSPAGTVNFSRSGNHVTLFLTAQITGTSDENSMTMTGLPAGIQPVSPKWLEGIQQIQDNSVFCTGRAAISGGTITFQKLTWDGTNIVGATFTASGAKGLANQWSCSYDLT